MSFKIKKHISLHAILLLIVMLVAVFFRFYNTPNRYGFDYDPTRDALVVDYAAKTLQFPLIGPPSGIGPFTFGPWYYYQLILFKIIFPVAYSPWIYIGILSTISVFIMHKIGVLLGGKKIGIFWKNCSEWWSHAHHVTPSVVMKRGARDWEVLVMVRFFVAVTIFCVGRPHFFVTAMISGPPEVLLTIGLLSSQHQKLVTQH